eukprot:12202610-Alexandrium_andersonii.AAC.1
MESHSERPDQGSVNPPQEGDRPPTGGGEAPDMGHPRREPLSIGGASEHRPQRLDEGTKPGD